MLYVIIGYRSSKSISGAKNALFFREGVPHGWSKLMKYSGITLKFDPPFCSSISLNLFVKIMCLISQVFY